MKYTKILVPTDGSEYGDMSEKRGLKLANEIGAELIVLTVAETNISPSFRFKKSSTLVSQAIVEEAEEVLNHAKELAKEYPNLDVTFELKEGHPANVILDVAKSKECDLVIMGSSGRSSINKFVMGSVVAKVVANLHCDALVIHEIV